MIEFQRQEQVVHDVRELCSQRPERGLDWALRQVCISRATWFRYTANVEKGPVCIKDRDAGGRPATFVLTDGERTALVIDSMKHDSIDTAIERFPRNAQCTPETADKIRRYLEIADRRGKKFRFPESLRRQARPTQRELDDWRGKRTFANGSMAPRVGLFWRDEQGRDIALRAHSAWYMDDYSTNEPYVVESPAHLDIRDRIAPQYQRALCRQVLVAKDIFSAAWLGMETIGRERDAYRAEDILRFIRNCIVAHGTMPATLILEQGRWKSSAVHGIQVHDGHRFRNWGGLDDIIEIRHVKDSRGKAGLESDIGHLQTGLAHTGLSIGRKRGEFENATKAYLAIQRQARMLQDGRIPDVLRDPLALGFLRQTECEELHAAEMHTLNQRAKERQGLERTAVPYDLLADAIKPRPLPPEEEWRFMPCKKEATIRRAGFIEVKADNYPRAFMFAVNGVSADVCLENGYAVLIAFDPAQPHLGCHVANAEVGVKNRMGYGFGEKIILAPHEADAPMWDDSPHDGPNRKKKHDTAVRTGFAGIKRHIRDTSALRISTVMDGRGNVQRTTNRLSSQTGTRNTEHEPTPAAPRRREKPAVDLEKLRRMETAALQT